MIEKIETLIEKLKQAGVDATLGASLVWTYAIAYVRAILTQDRIHCPSDPFFKPLSEERKTEALKRAEKRAGEARQAISWAAAFADPEFIPDGRSVVELLMKERSFDEMTNEQLLEQKAQILGLSPKSLAQVAEIEKARLEEADQLIRDMLHQRREALANEIDRAIMGYCPEEFDMSRELAIQTLRKMSQKVDQYKQRKLQLVLRARSLEFALEVGSSAKLLEALQQEVDTLLQQVEHEEISGEREVA